MRVYTIATQLSSSWVVHVTAEHAVYVDPHSGEIPARFSDFWSRDELLSIPGGQEALERWWSVRDDEYEQYMRDMVQSIDGEDGRIE